MILLNPTQKKMSLLSSLLLLVTACSKDADLLSDYVIAKDGDLQSIALLVDDRFFLGSGQTSIVMDVLNNDNFNGDAQVTIVETSTPKNGEVIINADNTLTYIPQTVDTNPETTTTEETTTASESAEVLVEDSFTYTTEVITSDNEVSREEATVTISTSDMGELLAFPGAEGFGKYTTGGRGGQVIHVTNLNDSGPGSLREALLTKGPRIVVFDVGGTIQLNSYLQIGSTQYSENVARENITIAGETAPYPGITIKGGVLDIYSSNVIVRYLTIRTNIPQVESDDAIRIRNWGTNGYNIRNIIIDHCSISHGSDENLDISCSSEGKDIRIENITIQNCLLGENTQQNKNSLRGPGVFNLSFLNNFLTECTDRNILVGYGSNGESLEFINNIIYGFEGGLAISWGNRVDAISNIYESFGSNPNHYNVITLGSQGYNNPINTGAIYVEGNFISGPMETNAHHYNQELLDFKSSQRVLGNSYISNWEKEKQAIENKVLSKVGNSLYRDSLDENWINSYINKNGVFGFTSVPPKQNSARPANYDTDNDGMADEWERSVFGDLSKSSNGDEDGNGYSNIESFFYYLTQ
ncbi:hypothetical protein [Maribacter aurantiacus]|uniref:Pectate lyase n=1 Tax=Maribacter aurantiacus TaxID=1882343 RepID=A0A5R8M4J5_9FLAO|nr:hypothetical protein [Maribacter aurantiacus]TLF44552.1 hypothetical protein FEK29_09910 [Maribacter aurantiacus]